MLLIAFVLPVVRPALAARGEGITFDGNVRYSRNQLLTAMRRFQVNLTGEFLRTEADDAAFFLREFYFDQGFSEASVGYDFQSPPSSVVFKIDEGGQLLIGSVEFQGNEALNAERLNQIFTAAVRQSNLHPFGQLRYVQSAVNFAMAEITRAMQQMGYLDASTMVAGVTATGRTVNLTVQIVEGVQYHVSDIQVEVRDSSEDTNDLLESLRQQVGRPYQNTVQALLRTRVQDWFRNRGYLEPQVRIDAQRNADDGNVNLVLNVNPGRFYRIGEIRVEGLEKTREDAVLARFVVKPGVPYNASLIDEGVRRLWFSGAFDDAEAKQVPNEDGTLDLRLQLKEGRARQLRFKLGYSEWERTFGEVRYIDRNFLGSLNRFSVDTFLSERGYGVSSELANPWFLGTDATGSVGAFFARRELPAYRATELGGTLGIERRYNSPNETGYRFGYEWKKVMDSQVFGEDDNAAQEDYTLGGLVFSQSWDTRNDVLSPMSGMFASHEVELVSPVLLGDLSFFRFEAQFTYYHPLWPITVERPFIPFIVLNHSAGLLVPYGNTEFVPVQERFFLGGPMTVRSYQLYGLGPRDSAGNPLGGLAMLLGNIELQWPLWNNIYIAGFSDVGNLAPDIDSLNFDETQVAIGSGIRVYTPIGAIRVDYGYNVNRDPGDPVGNWQFGFGFTF